MTIESTFKTTEFTVGDPSKLFEILRSKMYSNPIESICREILCNARDAHREIGKNNIPIEVYFPNFNDPYLRIKDFGPGISPDRMENVYCKYTATTKTGTNQTGGYGLGAKSVFAYTDSFNVITCVDGTKYSYVAFIDESGKGSVSLLDASETKSINGTEIVIPIKETDYKAFSDGLYKTMQYWDVKPILYKDSQKYNVSFKQKNIICSGPDWTLYENATYEGYKQIMLLDGIQYPIDYNKENYLNKINVLVVINTNISDISISSTRENLYYDDKTKNYIDYKMPSILKQIEETTVEDIQNQKCIYDACIKIYEFYSKFRVIPNSFYKIIYNNENLLNFYNKFEHMRSSKGSFEYFPTEQLVKENKYSNLLISKRLLILNDLDSKRTKSFYTALSKRIPKDLLLEYKNQISLIKFYDQKDIDTFKNVIKYKVSDFYKQKKVSTTALKKSVYILDRSRFSCISKNIIPEGNKILVSLERSYGSLLNIKGYNISFYDLQAVSKFLKLPVIGTTSEIDKKINDIVGPSISITEAVDLIKSQLDIETYRDYLNSSEEITFINDGLFKLKELNSFVHKIFDYENSDFFKVNSRLSYLKNIQTHNVINHDLWGLIFNDVKKSDRAISEETINAFNNIKSKYPLLYLINYYAVDDKNNDHLVNYINLVNGK